MQCGEAARVQAYFDGELDAHASARIEQHLAQCSGCAAALQELQSARDIIRVGAYYRAGAQLRSRIADLLDKDVPKPTPIRGATFGNRSFWLGTATGFVPAAIAAALLFVFYAGNNSARMTDDLVSAHLRSLVAGHLIDVASSDQHTVKPWFAGHADVSPPVVDFPDQNYRLVGGRTDFVDNRRAAVVVYRHAAHVIDVFSWAQNGVAPPEMSVRNGYHVVCWRNSDLDSCAVSDAALDELLPLVGLLKNLPS